MSYSNKVKETLKTLKPGGDQTKSFFRELFISSGSISDPAGAYHLEFVLADEKRAREIQKTAHSEGIMLKYVRRRSKHVLYLKSSEQIEDFLYYIDASGISFEMMETKILKEVRNNANRVTNFEGANLDKISRASALQIAAINGIIESGRFELLPEELRQTARLRLENIEMSIQEIGEISEPPVSKSGVKHRMRRIMDIAAGLK
jgi:hypothetical protein